MKSTRIYKSVVSIILILAMTICAFCFDGASVAAAELGSGHIVCAQDALVQVYSEASTSSTKMHKLENGKELTVLEKVTGADGATWYKIYFRLKSNNEERICYVQSQYVEYTPTGSGDSVIPSAPYATGTITGTNVSIRNAAGTSGTTILTSVNRGQIVSVFGETTVGGVIWYNVTGNKGGTEFTGWVTSAYLSVTYAAVDDSDYAKTLKTAGFPDSYINNLVALHTKHPNWTFVPVMTGLDWNTVIQNESVNGRNLVQNSTNDARKSTASGAYNWTTNKWTVYDGTSWVSANPDYIAYCMDPRNFLDETNIFQFESLSYSTNHNLAGVQAIVKGTFMETDVKDTDGKTLNYAQTFLDVGKASGVSPYHLAARVKQEQGAGTSSLISGTYSGYAGYYNYFNFKASGVGNDAIIKNGLEYAKNQGWNSRYKSILGGAKLIGDGYINKGQDTLYTEKFNVTNKAALYSHQYMGNVTAAITEGQSVAKGYTDKNQAFIFKIPVYNNMPSSAVKFSDTGNPNNYLSSLSVSGVSLTPAFSGSTTSYSIVVPNSVSSVTVSAKPVASTSTVSGTGNHNLAIGSNTIKVNCKSQSGVTKTYTLSISRQAASSTPAPSGGYTVTSSKYKVGTNITGITPGTSASALKSGLSSSGTVKILTAGGSENNGNVATGNKVAVYDSNGALKTTYEVVVYGDSSGDGVVSIKDLIMINRHILGTSKMSGSALSAADASKDGVISIKDLIMVNNHILGKSTLSQ